MTRIALVDEGLALGDELVARDGVAAGGLHRVDRDADDLARAREQGEVAGERLPGGVAGADDVASAVEAEDERLLPEAREHHGDAPVGGEVGGRLVA